MLEFTVHYIRVYMLYHRYLRRLETVKALKAVVSPYLFQNPKSWCGEVLSPKPAAQQTSALR